MPSSPRLPPPGVRAAALAALLALAAGPAGALGLWDELSDAEKQAVLQHTRSEIDRQLAAPNSPLVRDDRYGNDDPILKDILQSYVRTDVEFFSTQAGRLVAGDYATVTDAVLDRAADKLAGELVRWVAGKLPEGSPTRVYFDYLAAKREAWGKVGRAFFDPRQSWSDVAALTWKELNQAAAKDLEAELEAALAWAVDEAVGGGSVPGVSPGQAYVLLLRAQTALWGGFEEVTVRQTADTFYREYRARRDAGAAADVAWEQIWDHLVGEGGLGSFGPRQAGRSLPDLRAGGYLLRHVDEGALRQRYEACYRDHADPCTVDVATAFSEQQRRTRAWVEQRVAAVRRQVVGEEPLIRPAEVRSLFSHFLEEVARTLREEMARVHRATAAEQRRLAEARYAADATTARLEQLRAEVCGRRAELASLAAAAGDRHRQLADLHDRLRGVEGLAEKVKACSALAPDAPGAGDRAAAVLRAMQAALAQADRLATAACRWDEPANEAAAQAVLRQALDAGRQTSEAAEEVRRGRGDLAALAAATPQAVGDDERRQLEAALSQLAAAADLAAGFRGQRGKMREIVQRAGRQLTVGRGWTEDLRRELAPFTGLAEADQLLAGAEGLLGERRNLESDDTLVACVARLETDLRTFEAATRDADALERTLDQWRGAAEVALAVCPEEHSPLAGALADLVAEGDRLVEQAAWQEQAAALCVARARQLHPAASAGSPATPSTAGEGGAAAGWQSGERSDRLDRCRAPRPAYEAALRAVVAALAAQDLEGLPAPLAGLAPECPGDRQRLEALREQGVRLAQAEADANAAAMSRDLGRSRAAAARRAAAWAAALGAAQGILAEIQRAQSQTPEVGTGLGGAATGGGAGAAGGGSGSRGSCLVLPTSPQPGTSGGEWRYYVAESAAGGARGYQILKLNRDQGGGIGYGGRLHGPYTTLAAAQAALDRLCPPAARVGPG